MFDRDNRALSQRLRRGSLGLSPTCPGGRQPSTLEASHSLMTCCPAQDVGGSLLHEYLAVTETST